MRNKQPKQRCKNFIHNDTSKPRADYPHRRITDAHSSIQYKLHTRRKCLTLFLIRVIGTRVSFYKATLNENLIVNVVFRDDEPREMTPVLRYAPPNLSKCPSKAFPSSLNLADPEDRIHIIEMLDKMQQMFIGK
ncbi:unnamed protein product [Didymodactylos carnosus]|uniref:Uncharacterized protein n=1 Tax=Didymodactylos carnosus TaxID=1234261 RepID=A0A814JP05_9BILA|nr:unnamed protein product [Didymodactylos carnosus]CAF1304724.1 unnamed protein product [Didymodactylos carnosus]CAF3812024.1 unnamed protein product [Didymodactylos carnosus]CAF4111557.1 unnamed protein product [Didymodactylos carnosus]